MAGTGSVKHVDAHFVFEPGDGVALKDSILQNSKKYPGLVPRELIKKMGWPNEFLVLKTARTPGGEPAVSIFPCCYLLVRKGDYRCRYHPAEIFVPAPIENLKPGVLGEGRPDGRGNRTHSIKTPLDEVVSLEYEDDKDPRLNITTHGICGQLLRGLFKLGKQKGIL